MRVIGLESVLNKGRHDGLWDDQKLTSGIGNYEFATIQSLESEG